MPNLCSRRVRTKIGTRYRLSPTQMDIKGIDMLKVANSEPGFFQTKSQSLSLSSQNSRSLSLQSVPPNLLS